MHELYRPLYLNETPMLFTTLETSELIKYASNAFLATKITFINEMADLCEKVGADVQAVARGVGLDRRIGPKFLHAGPGYGGSCFPKDTLALVRTAHDAGAPTKIVSAVVEVNDARKARMADKIVKAVPGGVDGKTIAVLGLTFKPNTDDMRDSPSLAIVPRLLAKGARIQAFDPEGMEEARKQPELEGIEYCEGPYDAAREASAVVILTEWNAFRALNLKKLDEAMKEPLMIDLRNIYEPKDVREAGFTYVCVGRGAVMGDDGGSTPSIVG
jgi:UDPglucose 6-dehydrogenase